MFRVELMTESSQSYFKVGICKKNESIVKYIKCLLYLILLSSLYKERLQIKLVNMNSI